MSQALTTSEQNPIDNPIEPEIEKAKPVAKWECYVENQSYGVNITLYNQKNSISGTLTYFENGESMVYIDMFVVDENMRQMGIGTRLLKSLTAEAIAYGANFLSGHVTSESALRTRAKVFGQKNLQFFHHGTNKRINMSYEELLKSNLKPDVVVDLGEINTEDWERPIRSKD